ncbi:zinc metalloprotease [Anaeromicropila herbilytica]|uniref:Uncharacterized protein n=1 Tax=Anaeromicropila herbilytica TaxID=2785025 RepID=A0A7R7EQ24_9FIRM|nr:hypothetical protein [Anaeromicropila herbilytica]BCN32892.1 hypothetical protein bsdtb5_41870 [Anaeromicropila herbilytica]
MNLIDTYSEVERLFIGKTFSKDTWRNYANSIESNLAKRIEADSNEYDYERKILPVLNLSISSNKELEQLHQSFLKVTEKLQERVMNIFGKDLDVDIILYLGLCNGAGWATQINGRKKVLLGIEKIIELHWYDENNLAALIYHELGHIWHDTTRNVVTEIVTQSQHAIWRLYREGVAMYCEQLLYNKGRFYHQNINGWLEWCDRNRSILIAEYKQRVTRNENVQEFFGDWCKFMEHSDVGYYLGAEFVGYLAKEYTLNDIANMDLEVLINKFLLEV